MQKIFLAVNCYMFLLINYEGLYVLNLQGGCLQQSSARAYEIEYPKRETYSCFSVPLMCLSSLGTSKMWMNFQKNGLLPYG